jgi:DnaJ-class molecular chaperone
VSDEDGIYKCDECLGTGYDFFDFRCAYCNGSGKVDEDGEAIE